MPDAWGDRSGENGRQTYDYSADTENQPVWFDPQEDDQEYDDLYDDGFDELTEDEDDEPEEEESPEARAERFRTVRGAGNIVGVVSGVVLILVLIAFLLQMIHFVVTDMSRNLVLFQNQF